MIPRSLGLLALATAVVLGLPDTSQAQMYRWGRGWRGDDGWGWYGGRSGFYYTAGYPYGVSYGYGRRYYPYGYSYSYYPAWYTRYTYNPTYYSPTVYTEQSPGAYAYQSAYPSPEYAYQSAYPSPEVVNEMPDPGQRALVGVRVANPDAQLWIDHHEMTSDGILRTFISP